MNKWLIYILSLTVFTGCHKSDKTLFDNPSPINTGLDFVNSLDETKDLSILDYLYFYNGGGVAIGDINNDGLPDIYLSGNQVKNKLYLNKGNLTFEDITEDAGAEGHSTWNTGSVMGDVNGDGFLDIYVCAVVGINGFYGSNELFINNGDNTFTESASKYGLDFETYSSTAAFLDYDLDGDLDIYLLNHAIHTQESFGKSNQRYKRNEQTGDKLLRNDNGIFSDVSEEAGIYGGPNGYGLGITVADFNQDGYPDMYVGNDFHEDDYYYLNNGDGTFSEKAKEFFGHTSRFSMGNDFADINHDGLPDIISLDMLPEDETVLKSSQGDEDIQVQELRIKQYGYNYQFSRNMLYVNQSNEQFLETALLSGVAATDWSWSALFGDYNQDGEQDLFISNGIPKRPNDLDFIKFVSSDKIKSKIVNTKLVDQEALGLMPSGRIHNYIFKGNGDLSFVDQSDKWISHDTLVSGATAIGDLDNDGDLDVVVNNINDVASIYKNNTDSKSNYIKLKFKYKAPNVFGIGTKVFSYTHGKIQFQELYTVRGFQASSEPLIHFGYGNLKSVDSIKIVWPDHTYQTLTNVKVNQTLLVEPKDTRNFNYSNNDKRSKPIFKKREDNLGIDFVHVEDDYLDFNRQKLIPYKVSDRGPAVALGDLNNDGEIDVFFGGSKHHRSKIFIKRDSSFVSYTIPEIAQDSVKEDVAAVIADFNNDKKNDLFLGSGGADFYSKMKPLLDTYYVQNDSGFVKKEIPDFFENASVIKPCDFDKDGYLDLFVGNNAVSNDFGNIGNSFILKNDKGRFYLVENEALQKAGMITDAIWNDFDHDGKTDLIVVGEWMSPKFFKNTKDGFVEVNMLSHSINGLWQAIVDFDIDGDGDTDYLLGNWGVNTKFKASQQYPMKMFYSDFDLNGSTETIVCTEKDGDYFPLLGLDELSSQMVVLKKKFVNYRDFAGKTIDDLFESKVLKKAKVLEVHELRSGYLRNDDNTLSFIPFKNELQVSPLTCFLKFDFDNNGENEVLTAGNYFGVSPFHGRFDSFPGAVIKSETDVVLANELGLKINNKSARHLNIIESNHKPYLLVTLNNDKAQVYELLN
ncbi:VCBS repeat-containing protein [Aestuariivivens sediminis]|uniref:VCBS repeat-containing protein n=1 Tax=Aestuariivivens sediminis TaxID=2913557 RepID=UPI001F5A1F85|nr:VCBS repeat-containing protein [Aestuariivivens sediminis]